MCGKKASILSKRNPFEMNIGSYNTVTLKLLKSNMNLQFVTGTYAILGYLTSYLCNPEHAMSKLMKKTSKEAYGKDIKGKMLSTGNTFLTRVLSLPMRHSSIDLLYVPTGLKNNRTRMLKSLSTLEKMYPDDTNVFASSIIDKYENQPANLHSMCLADFASSYIRKKVDDLPREPDEIKSYTVPVINDVKFTPNIVVLKNELGEMQKRSRPCVIHFHEVSKLQLYMPWRNENELKQDNQSCKDRYKEVEDDILCNIKKHEPFLDINYEELQLCSVR